MKIKIQEVLEAFDGAGMEIGYYYDIKNQQILMVLDGRVDGETVVQIS